MVATFIRRRGRTVKIRRERKAMGIDEGRRIDAAPEETEIRAYVQVKAASALETALRGDRLADALTLFTFDRRAVATKDTFDHNGSEYMVKTVEEWETHVEITAERIDQP